MKLLKNNVAKWMLCLCVGFLAACGVSGSGAEDVAKQAMQAMLDGDIETLESHSVSTITEEERGITEFGFSMLKAKTESRGGIDKISTELKDFNKDKKSAKVKVTALFNNEEKQVQVFDLVYRNKKWKIK